MRFKLVKTVDGGPRIVRAESASARDTIDRLYGHPVDIDKVWQDRDALHGAQRSMIGEKP